MRNRRAWAVLIALIAAPQSHADDQRSPSVGVAARIDQLVLPGPELEARPLRDRESPIVLRVAETYPHGSDFRYDLIYYGLDPGRYDLRDYLQRKDGSSTAGLPPVPVEIRAVLPPGQIEPNRLVIERAPSLGGYRLLLGAAGFAWIAGLAAILLAGKRRHALAAAAARPLTLADRLRPLVEAARHGALEPGQHAELERMLIGYWRRRLGLADASHARAIAVMREHPEAGPLLRALEDWLHRPGHADAVDVGDLLEPYRDLPADALEAEPTPAAAGREG